MSKKKIPKQGNGMMINQDIQLYIRLHPKWYLILSRYHEEYKTLLEEYKIKHKMTLADRIEKVGFMLQMVEMLL